MIVLDASAALAGLLNDGPARRLMTEQQLHCPHLVDAEVASGLRRLVLTGRVSVDQGRAALAAWSRLGVSRYPMTGLLDRVWQLRENLSAYDACYVVVAERLDCSVVTGDARLGRAPGPACAITLVPS